MPQIKRIYPRLEKLDQTLQFNEVDAPPYGPVPSCYKGRRPMETVKARRRTINWVSYTVYKGKSPGKVDLVVIEYNSTYLFFKLIAWVRNIPASTALKQLMRAMGEHHGC